jgi:hypothetical protein
MDRETIDLMIKSVDTVCRDTSLMYMLVRSLLPVIACEMLGW